MLSVGVLVPVEAGRLGQSFLFAQELKDLAKQLINNQATITPLEEFWETHKSKEESSGAIENLATQRSRASSSTSLSIPNAAYSLAPHHPALALPELLQTFGPLIFPVYRAVLLQKRILIMGEAPVEIICDYVYCLSILSSISKTDASRIPNFDASKARARPLFNVGISDIPRLESLEYPWIACTTDDVLATKPQLFDVLVIMPNSSITTKYGPRIYPKVIMSNSNLTKEFPKQGHRATMRDAKRFAALKTALVNLSSAGSPNDVPTQADDTASTISSVSTLQDSRETVEPTPWSVIAYTSLVWWASAGDRRSGLMEAEELANEEDEALLRDSVSEDGTTKEVALVAYFHKLTLLIFSVLAHTIKRTGEPHQERFRDEETSEDEPLITSKNDDHPIDVTEEDIRAMGLDIWSSTDQRFVEEVVQKYWHRQATVHGGVIECCGIRLL